MSLSSGHGTHTAKNFNDTSDGAVHCFMDEHGNWVTYTFDEKGIFSTLKIKSKIKLYFNLQFPGSTNTTNNDPLSIQASQDKRPRQRRLGLDNTNKTQGTNNELWDSNDSLEASSASTMMGSRNNSRPSIGQESVQLR